ncbi:hypothetical protein KBC04_03170 [Candidatus Babeliales bacterium]|nr:hypothetical protein [Candidatus Babeliales bacterium]MBP9843948.1 hypothetical protein [Candidatus Babeliales bacterium]
MNIKNLYLLVLSFGFIFSLQASNAYNNDATYGLTGPNDDMSPIGTSAQKDDLDVSVAQSLLVQAVLDGNFNKVKILLESKNHIFSSKELAAALYYSVAKKHQDITDLLSQYAANLDRQ